MGDDKLKGKTNEFVGGAREKAGDVTGDEEMQADGAGQQLKGKGQGFVGDVKDKAEDLKDKVT
jgi:uncharacterized protein YjbJ (UPF0337 family)